MLQRDGTSYHSSAKTLRVACLTVGEPVGKAAQRSALGTSATQCLPNEQAPFFLLSSPINYR
ncbi:hypothetical protein [Nostoc sp. T09]|uniref:hypothetical protein n=1 Tax=Nostoc sp. T09 TaxID=1932621 RepID=UPI00118123EF|nr:hypothetical protein [Nostoc sp. T09]